MFPHLVCVRGNNFSWCQIIISLIPSLDNKVVWGFNCWLLFSDIFYLKVLCNTLTKGCDCKRMCRVNWCPSVTYVGRKVLIMAVQIKTQIRPAEPDYVMQYTYHTETHFPPFNRVSQTGPTSPPPPTPLLRRKLHCRHKTRAGKAVVKPTVKRKRDGPGLLVNTNTETSWRMCFDLSHAA